MKNQIFKANACILSATLFMPGCRRRKPATEPAKPSGELSSTDRAVMQRVLKFREKGAAKKDNPTYKSSKIVQIDSARWDVETNFNATYAFPDENYTTTRHDSAELFLTVIDDSTTLMDNVLAFNDQVFNQALALYNSNTFANRKRLFVSLRKQGDGNENESGDRGARIRAVQLS